MKNVDIIVPVYKGFEETKDCIESTLSSLPSWANLIVINDSSPEPDLTNWLRENSEKKSFLLLENTENRGFVATVNRGMSLNLDNDILLLNSDVEVSKGNWLERMRLAAYSKANVGSITPFSNNATICSFPNFCEDNELFADLSVDELDNIFSDLHQDNVLVEIPTGVGFCMYIPRDALNEVGYFDEETFGKGYGEENDWCQRAIKKGWLNYHQTNVFAYHKGGVSFAEEGNPRKQQAMKLLVGLHPSYEQQIQKFVLEDPASKIRTAAIIHYLNVSNKKKIMLVSHNLGGGVQQHIDEIVELFGEKVDFILATPSDSKNKIILQYFLGSIPLKLRQTVNLEDDEMVLQELLEVIGLDRVHFHHTIGMPDIFFNVVRSLKLPYDFTAHDYYLFNGNPTLSDCNGKFVDDSIKNRDELCLDRRVVNIPINEFKEKSKNFLVSADRIIFPSVDEYLRFLSEFPFIKGKSIVCYHPDLNDSDIRKNVRSFKSLPGKKMKVLILGALSQEKGADLLEQVAINLGDIEFHLLGYAYRSLSGVITHGAYQHNELEKNIYSIEPDVIWFPAKSPETYSYTLSTALTFKYPIICFDIGAFSERTLNREGTLLLDRNLELPALLKFWQNYSQNRDVREFTVIRPNEEFNIDVLDKFFYETRYLEFNKVEKNKIEEGRIINLSEKIEILSNALALNRKERILAFLWKIKNLQLISSIVRFIPYKIQRYIKRKLSAKPMHDIINNK